MRKPIKEQTSGKIRPPLILLLLLIVFAGTAGIASAQLNIPVVRGDNGLKSGSQPGPGVYLTGLLYFYNADEIVDANGTNSIEWELTSVCQLQH